MNEMATQRRALSAAREARAEMLHEIALGGLKPDDVVDMARDSSWSALRPQSLRQLILSEPKSGLKQWRQIRDRMLDVLDIRVPDKELTIGWVLDSRAGGRRYLAFKDALRPRDKPPWPGFPWEPRPQHPGRHG